MKKIGLFFIALTMSLLIPLSSADAGGNGQWDYKGAYDLTKNSYGYYDTANVRSTGGGIKLYANFNLDSSYQLWESDPGPGNDDYIGSWDWATGIFNVNNYVDGSNNRAELYVATYDYARGNFVKFWD